MSETTIDRVGIAGEGQRYVVHLAVAIVLSVAVAGILLRPPVPPDETRYLAVAWEMWQTGDLLVPTRNFDLYTHKPPLLFWLINLVWTLTGVSEVSGRLVAPLFACLAIPLTSSLARRLWPEDDGAASRAALVLGSLTGFLLYGGLVMFDTLLTVAVLGGLHALLGALDTGRTRWWLALGGAMAFGVLAKGPVVFVHILPVTLLAPLLRDPASRPSWQGYLAGVAIALLFALAVVSLWLIPALLEGGDRYASAILWEQSAGRVHKAFAHARPWWFYLAVAPALLFPWVFMPGLWRAALRADWRDDGSRLVLAWLAPAVVIFGAISGKQAHYLLPELPAVTLIVSRVIARQRSVGLAVPAMVLAAIAAGGALMIQSGMVAVPGTPDSYLWLFALVPVALFLAMAPRIGFAGALILGVAPVLALDGLIATTPFGRKYDTGGIAAEVARYAQSGIAFVGDTYQAEFNFAARLTRPVALPLTGADLRDWMAAHPRGVVVAPVGTVELPWTPAATVPVGLASYRLWHVGDAPHAGT